MGTAFKESAVPSPITDVVEAEQPISRHPMIAVLRSLPENATRQRRSSVPEAFHCIGSYARILGLQLALRPERIAVHLRDEKGKLGSSASVLEKVGSLGQSGKPPWLPETGNDLEGPFQSLPGA